MYTLKRSWNNEFKKARIPNYCRTIVCFHLLQEVFKRASSKISYCGCWRDLLLEELKDGSMKYSKALVIKRITNKGSVWISSTENFFSIWSLVFERIWFFYQFSCKVFFMYIYTIIVRWTEGLNRKPVSRIHWRSIESAVTSHPVGRTGYCNTGGIFTINPEPSMFLQLKPIWLSRGENSFCWTDALSITCSGKCDEDTPLSCCNCWLPNRHHTYHFSTKYMLRQSVVSDQ
jgi:hypothetical protein